MSVKPVPNVCGMKVSTLTCSIATLNYILDALPETMPGDVVISALASFGPPVTDFLLAFRKNSAQIIHDPSRTYSKAEVLKFFMNQRQLRKVFAGELRRIIADELHGRPNKVDQAKLDEVFHDLYFATSSKPLRLMYPKLKPGYIRRIVWVNRSKINERWEIVEGVLLKHCNGHDPAVLKSKLQKILKFAFQLKAGYLREEIPNLSKMVEEIHSQQHLNFQTESCP